MGRQKETKLILYYTNKQAARLLLKNTVCWSLELSSKQVIQLLVDWCPSKVPGFVFFFLLLFIYFIFFNLFCNRRAPHALLLILPNSKEWHRWGFWLIWPKLLEQLYSTCTYWKSGKTVKPYKKRIQGYFSFLVLFLRYPYSDNLKWKVAGREQVKYLLTLPMDSSHNCIVYYS